MTITAYTRRDFLKTAVLGGASLAVLPFLSGCALCAKRPNIVLIYIDDLGWKDLGVMGSDYYQTPHIDRLASQGMIFTNAYANAPNCAPSRASLLTGQYTPRHGIYTVNSAARGKARDRKLVPIPNAATLVPQAVTLAEVLKSLGYVSASIGKWHLGVDPETGPLGQGFDLNIGGNRAGHPRSYFSPYHNSDLADAPGGEYLTDRLTAEALKFIDNHQDQPFFLYLTHYAVHTPLQAREELIAKYRGQGEGGQSNPIYAAMIESVDQSVGSILGRLDDLGLRDDTIVLFFSDNGGYGPATSMEPLRGAKGMLYEGGIRVPLIVRWPGKVEPGATCAAPVIGTDLFPTFLDITGAPRPQEQPLDGESLAPLLTGRGTLDRDALFWHFPAYLEAYRGGRSQGPWRTTPAGAIRQGDWKLIEFFEDGRLELYNLKEDIGEANNLAETRPGKAKALHERLKAWRRSVNAPVPTEPNPFYQPRTDGG